MLAGIEHCAYTTRTLSEPATVLQQWSRGDKPGDGDVDAGTPGERGSDEIESALRSMIYWREVVTRILGIQAIDSAVDRVSC